MRAAPPSRTTVRRALIAAHAVATFEASRRETELPRPLVRDVIDVLRDASDRIGEGAPPEGLRAHGSAEEWGSGHRERRAAWLLAAAALEGDSLAARALEDIARGTLGLLVALASPADDTRRANLWARWQDRAERGARAPQRAREEG